MTTGWTRVCPDCGNSDGAKVERIAFHPTFRCECGYVWDGSQARLLVLARPPRSATDGEREAFADASFGTMASGTGDHEE